MSRRRYEDVSGKTPVLMIFEGLDLGGAERHIVDVASGLKNQMGRDVVVATQGGILESELVANGVIHEIIPGVRYAPAHLLRVARRIDRLARKYHAGILHSHSRYHNLACLIASRVFQTPAMRVATAHNVYPDKHRLSFWPPNTICVSAAAEAYVRRHSRSRTRVILNGIPPLPVPESVENIRRKLGITSDAIVLINVGRLTEQKSQGRLLEAFAELIRRPEMDSLHLLIVGEGDLRRKLEQSIDALSLGRRVTLLGNRTDVAVLLAASDIFALSSRWEGLGIVLIEAASCGLPLVSFQVGGVVEVVHHGETGLLVEPEDVTGFTDALWRLVKDPALRHRMGREGKKMYAEKFTLDKCVSETESFYSDLEGR